MCTQIMHATDDATSLASQRTLVSFMRVLYLGVEPPEGLAPRIVADCLDVLEEPAKVLAPHAATILACLVRAAPSTAYLALYGMLEQMLTYWKNADDVSVRAPILEHIGTLLRALRDAYEGRETWGAAAPSQPAAKAVGFGTASSSTSAVTPTPVSAEGSTAAPKASPAPARSYEIDSRPLEPFRDDLVGALANGLRSTQYRLPALHAFLALARIPGFLEAREIDYLTEGVNELLLAAHGDEVRGPALDGLRELSLRHSHILEATTLPLLFAALPDRMSSSGDAALQEAERSRLRRALSALARLCAQPNLFDTLVVRVVTKLDLACAADYSAPAEREANVGYVRGLLVTLQTLLEDKASERHTDLPRYAVSLPPRLLSLVFAAAVRSSAGAAAVPVAADPRVVADVGSAVTTLVRMLEPAKQQSLVAWLYPLIEAGQQGPLSLGPGLASSEVRFLPLATDAQPAHRAALPAFLAAYVALHKSVPPPRGGDAVQWARELLPWTLAAASRAEETAGCAALAAVFNKSIAEPLQPEAAALLDDFWHSCIEQASADPQRRRIALRIWCWIAKALMTRTSAAAEGMLLRILSLFDTPDLARDAARGLGLIARTDDGVLSKENGAVVRLLHRQRFYSFVLPKIIAGYREAQPAPGAPAAAVQGVYLIALAALLPSMPRQTTRERLSDLFPLLLRALDLPDAGARASAAQTVALAAAVGKKERSDAILAGSVPEGAPKRENMPLDLVESHVSTLIERLLSVATPSEHSPAVSLPSCRVICLLDADCCALGHSHRSAAMPRVPRALRHVRGAAPAPRARSARPRRSRRRHR
jgi:DNA repair/transcription protein MET18/MMS19